MILGLIELQSTRYVCLPRATSSSSFAFGSLARFSGSRSQVIPGPPKQWRSLGGMDRPPAWRSGHRRQLPPDLCDRSLVLHCGRRAAHLGHGLSEPRSYGRRASAYHATGRRWALSLRSQSFVSRKHSSGYRLRADVEPHRVRRSGSRDDPVRLPADFA